MGHWLVSRLGFCGGTLSPQLGGAVARGSPAGTQGFSFRLFGAEGRPSLAVSEVWAGTAVGLSSQSCS